MNGTTIRIKGGATGFARAFLEASGARRGSALTTLSRLWSHAPVDLMDWDEASAHAEEWRDLAANASEPNVFLEPAFALSAAQHLPRAERPRFLLVRSAPEPEGFLIAVLALEPFGRSGPGRAWLTPNTTLAAPLLRRGFEAEALDALHAWMREAGPETPVMVFPSVDPDGPTARSLMTYAAARGLPATVVAERRRAALRPPKAGGAPSLLADGKRRRELKRAMARLAERGVVAFETARTPEAVRVAMERFLALEASGWKGEAGTAFVCKPALATFARTMSRTMAAEGKFRVETLTLDGVPIAAGLVLVSGPHAFFWKMAYDESYAAYAPGVQLTVALGRALIEEGATLVDSCAVPDHPTMDRCWLDRRVIADLVIGAEPHRARFNATLRREARRRRFMGAARALVHRWRRWRR